MKNYVLPVLLVIVAAAIMGSSGYLYFQYYATPRCEACGMLITPEMDRNIIMIDVDTGQRIWTCCPGCMLRSVAAHPNVNITALDSWYGTSAASIQIIIRNGSVVSVEPETARILLGSKVVASCANNRIAINSTSIELLLDNGWNQDNPLAVFKNQLPEGVPVLAVSDALVGLKAKGISYVPPSTAFIGGIALVGILVLLIGFVAWRKLSAPVKATVKTN
ncbi:MAG: hypothetical protein H5T33_01830 [Candidatus Methanosuratus sp.]|nr:hypothetical protein [Candidatus Methanosuratincola sp.]